MLEILELYCELLIARIGLLESKECDPGLSEAVHSLVYAAPRTEIKELHAVRHLLADKFGKEFTLAAIENPEGKVSVRVLERLKVEPPRQELVEAYLSTIAEAYGVEYPPGSRRTQKSDEMNADDDDDDDDDEPGDGAKVQLAAQPQPQPPPPPPPVDVGPKSPVSVNPPNPSTENPKPAVKMLASPRAKDLLGAKGNGAAAEGGPKKAGGGPGGKIPDVDELAKRFAQLKQR